jgi:hypothetical protein
MWKLRLFLYLLTVLSASLLLVSNVTAQTGIPTGTPYVYNVMDSTYGALCNGTGDDYGPIQHALNDANTHGGGVVFIPLAPGNCVINEQLNMDNFTGVSLAGPPAGNGAFGSNPRPQITFTATSWSYPSLISMRSTEGVSIKNLILQNNISGFSGTFIDLSAIPTYLNPHTGKLCSADPLSCISSKIDYIADSTIQGTATANQSNPLLSLDNDTDITIERNIFEWGVNAIVGPAASGHFANGIRIRDNRFGGYNTNSISGNMILNLGQAWTIDGNVFDLDGVGSTVPINAYSLGCIGCQISGNWISDVASGFTGALISGRFLGTSMTGNFITGGGLGKGTAVSLYGEQGCSIGTSITGNYFQALQYAVSFISGCETNVLVYGNMYDSSVSFAINGNPQSGIVTDDAGLTHVYGTLAKQAGSFMIDHPLDPENKYLSHSFVESPDMMNIYNGVVKLNAKGRAVVTLPSYFEALNQDFRYQVTPVGAFAPIYVAQKIKGNSFHIAGGKPGMEVSWQVTGIRHDAYANAHRIAVEEEKPSGEKGRLSYPGSEHPESDHGQISATPPEIKSESSLTKR